MLPDPEQYQMLSEEAQIAATRKQLAKVTAGSCWYEILSVIEHKEITIENDITLLNDVTLMLQVQEVKAAIQKAVMTLDEQKITDIPLLSSDEIGQMIYTQKVHPSDVFRIILNKVAILLDLKEVTLIPAQKLEKIYSVMVTYKNNYREILKNTTTVNNQARSLERFKNLDNELLAEEALKVVYVFTQYQEFLQQILQQVKLEFFTSEDLTNFIKLLITVKAENIAPKASSVVGFGQIFDLDSTIVPSGFFVEKIKFARENVLRLINIIAMLGQEISERLGNTEIFFSATMSPDVLAIYQEFVNGYDYRSMGRGNFIGVDAVVMREAFALVSNVKWQVLGLLKQPKNVENRSLITKGLEFLAAAEELKENSRLLIILKKIILGVALTPGEFGQINQKTSLLDLGILSYETTKIAAFLRHFFVVDAKKIPLLQEAFVKAEELISEKTKAISKLHSQIATVSVVDSIKLWKEVQRLQDEQKCIENKKNAYNVELQTLMLCSEVFSSTDPLQYFIANYSKHYLYELINNTDAIQPADGERFLTYTKLVSEFLKEDTKKTLLLLAENKLQALTSIIASNTTLLRKEINSLFKPILLLSLLEEMFCITKLQKQLEIYLANYDGSNICLMELFNVSDTTGKYKALYIEKRLTYLFAQRPPLTELSQIEHDFIVANQSNLTVQLKIDACIRVLNNNKADIWTYAVQKFACEYGSLTVRDELIAPIIQKNIEAFLHAVTQQLSNAAKDLKRAQLKLVDLEAELVGTPLSSSERAKKMQLFFSFDETRSKLDNIIAMHLHNDPIPSQLLHEFIEQFASNAQKQNFQNEFILKVINYLLDHPEQADKIKLFTGGSIVFNSQIQQRLDEMLQVNKNYAIAIQFAKYASSNGRSLLYIKLINDYFKGFEATVFDKELWDSLAEINKSTKLVDYVGELNVAKVFFAVSLKLRAVGTDDFSIDKESKLLLLVRAILSGVNTENFVTLETKEAKDKTTLFATYKAAFSNLTTRLLEQGLVAKYKELTAIYADALFFLTDAIIFDDTSRKAVIQTALIELNKSLFEHITTLAKEGINANNIAVLVTFVDKITYVFTKCLVECNERTELTEINIIKTLWNQVQQKLNENCYGFIDCYQELLKYVSSVSDVDFTNLTIKLVILKDSPYLQCDLWTNLNDSLLNYIINRAQKGIFNISAIYLVALYGTELQKTKLAKQKVIIKYLQKVAVENFKTLDLDAEQKLDLKLLQPITTLNHLRPICEKLARETAEKHRVQAARGFFSLLWYIIKTLFQLLIAINLRSFIKAQQLFRKRNQSYINKYDGKTFSLVQYEVFANYNWEQKAKIIKKRLNYAFALPLTVAPNLVLEDQFIKVLIHDTQSQASNRTINNTELVAKVLIAIDDKTGEYKYVQSIATIVSIFGSEEQQQQFFGNIKELKAIERCLKSVISPNYLEISAVAKYAIAALETKFGTNVEYWPPEIKKQFCVILDACLATNEIPIKLLGMLIVRFFRGQEQIERKDKFATKFITAVLTVGSKYNIGNLADDISKGQWIEVFPRIIVASESPNYILYPVVSTQQQTELVDNQLIRAARQQEAPILDIESLTAQISNLKTRQQLYLIRLEQYIADPNIIKTDQLLTLEVENFCNILERRSNEIINYVGSDNMSIWIQRLGEALSRIAKWPVQNLEKQLYKSRQQVLKIATKIFTDNIGKQISKEGKILLKSFLQVRNQLRTIQWVKKFPDFTNNYQQNLTKLIKLFPRDIEIILTKLTYEQKQWLITRMTISQHPILQYALAAFVEELSGIGDHAANIAILQNYTDAINAYLVLEDLLHNKCEDFSTNQENCLLKVAGGPYSSLPIWENLVDDILETVLATKSFYEIKCDLLSIISGEEYFVITDIAAITCVLLFGTDEQIKKLTTENIGRYCKYLVIYWHNLLKEPTDKSLCVLAMFDNLLALTMKLPIAESRWVFKNEPIYLQTYRKIMILIQKFQQHPILSETLMTAIASVNIELLTKIIDPNPQQEYSQHIMTLQKHMQTKIAIHITAIITTNNLGIDKWRFAYMLANGSLDNSKLITVNVLQTLQIVKKWEKQDDVLSKYKVKKLQNYIAQIDKAVSRKAIAALLQYIYDDVLLRLEPTKEQESLLISQEKIDAFLVLAAKFSADKEWELLPEDKALLLCARSYMEPEESKQYCTNANEAQSLVLTQLPEAQVVQVVNKQDLVAANTLYANQKYNN
jgi:hypothetical protein